MYKLKDLKELEVFNKKGNKIGEVEDIAIDYYDKKILGFIVPKKMFSKENFISVEDVIIIGSFIVAKKTSKYKGLTFNEIKGLDIVDKNNKNMGNVEELLIDEEFKIKAMIVSKGFFHKFIRGKEVILLQESVLGKKNILYLGKGNIFFKSLPHSIWG